MRVNPIPEQAQNNFTILDAYQKAQSVLQKSDTPVCSISGGADSDIMMDMMCRLDRDNQMRYVFYNTGLEYQATLRHLDELEAKYGRKIERIRAIKPVPQAVREYGIPFCSKLASEKIHALQKVGFDFTDRPLFWFQGPDKDAYDQLFDIRHSDCYEIWGFKRTGCVGCPFSLTHGGWQEMEKTKLYEPKMYKACWAVFGKAYEYTRAYHDFQRREKEKQKAQTTMEGYL